MASNNLLFIILAVLVGVDLFSTLRSGRAHTRFHGTVTREHRPDRFWRYVWGDWAVLGFCVVTLFWGLLTP